MKPRPDQIPFLMRLPAAQRRQLKRWLTVENLTYAQAIARLKQRFGVVAKYHHLFSFWRRACQPKAAASDPARRVLLDLHLTKAKGGFRLRLVQRFPGARLFVNGSQLKPRRPRPLSP